MSWVNDDGLNDAEREELLAYYGAKYLTEGEVESGPHELYYFRAMVGKNLRIEDTHHGDSCWIVDCKTNTASVKSGKAVASEGMIIELRGYAPPQAQVELSRGTHLPYVNGCSTRQLLPPIRQGDPTLQFLRIPAYSKEQAHHIHSTVRVVYVLRGRGVSVVGMEGKSAKTELLPGMMVVLDPMSPHHFETPQGDHLEVVPFHVYSSVGALESGHPMFNGTHLMNQGE